MFMLENTKRMSLEDFVKSLVPPNFIVTEDAMDILLNNLNDKSLIANVMSAYDLTYKLVQDKGQVYYVGIQCGVCHMIPSSKTYHHLEIEKLVGLHSHLPIVPCPSCHQPCPLYFTRRYICSSCENDGYNKDILKIVCTTCNVADLTNAKKGPSKHFTEEDYLMHGFEEVELGNSANPLFQMDNKNRRQLNLQKMSVFLINRKDKKREEAAAK